MNFISAVFSWELSPLLKPSGKSHFLRSAVKVWGGPSGSDGAMEETSGCHNDFPATETPYPGAELYLPRDKGGNEAINGVE